MPRTPSPTLILSAPAAQRLAAAYFDLPEPSDAPGIKYDVASLTAHEGTPYEVVINARSAFVSPDRFTGSVAVGIYRPLRTCYRHATYPNETLVVRTRVPRATYDTLCQAVMRGIERLYARHDAALLDLREEVYRLRNVKHLPPEAREHARALGHSTRYPDLTEAACHYWLDVLNNCPDR